MDTLIPFPLSTVFGVLHIYLRTGHVDEILEQIVVAFIDNPRPDIVVSEIDQFAFDAGFEALKPAYV
jgi:hypothetical protein